MAIVVSLYVFANIAYIIVLPPNAINHTDTIALVLKPACRSYSQMQGNY